MPRGASEEATTWQESAPRVCGSRYVPAWLYSRCQEETPKLFEQAITPVPLVTPPLSRTATPFGWLTVAGGSSHPVVLHLRELDGLIR